MNENQKAILGTLQQYLEKNPGIRFGQALMNLNINQFSQPQNLELGKHLLRDIYNDTDAAILNRMK